MATFLKDRDRNVIPRWRDFRSTVGMGELEHPAETRISDYRPPDLETFYQDWRDNESLAFAGDLLSAASLSGDKGLAREAAEFVLERKSILGQHHPLVSLAGAALSPFKDKLAIDVPLGITAANADKIACVRKRLHAFPANAIDWVDLSLLFASRGLAQKSRRSMQVALGIAPNNRFVLRSAARLFLHLGEYDYAHEILKRSPAARVDPWICAAEIAVATAIKKSSRVVDSGIGILRLKHFSNHDTSELSSALGMLDFVNGSARNARKHIRSSLLSPNENSLAQARWMAKDMAGLQVSVWTEKFQVARPFEAAAWQAFIQHDWNAAVQNAESWGRDEPFSTRPAQLAAHICATHLEAFDQAIIFAKQGMIANPHEHGFRITSAFAYASSNRTREASDELKEIKGLMSAEIEVAKTANFGLIGFREGDIPRGRHFYVKAIDIASTKDNRTLVSTALAYWAREEALSGNVEDGAAILARAKEAGKSGISFETPLLIRKVENLLNSEDQQIVFNLPSPSSSGSQRRVEIARDPNDLGVVKLSWHNGRLTSSHLDDV